VVSNSGPLIHLAKISLIHILRELYGNILITLEVKVEVVDKGKERGYSDALLIEKAINNGWIKVVRIEVPEKIYGLAETAGLHKAEVEVIWLAYRRNIIALLDDSVARIFAKSMGVRVKGSLGVIVEAFRKNILTRNDALNALDKISSIMYLSSDVYRIVRNSIEKYGSSNVTHPL